MDGEEGTTKYAKGAKMEAKLVFKDESYKLEHERFVNQVISRI